MSVIVHFIPTLAGGGAERQLALLAVEQAQHGHTVHVAVRRGGVHEAALKRHGVQVHFLGDHRGLNPQLFFCMVRLLRVLRPDLVQTWLTQMDVVGGSAACVLAIPWVATERSSASAYAPRHMRWKSWLRQRVCRYASAVVANSTEGVAYWRDNLPVQRGDRVCKIGNAIDLSAIQAEVALGREMTPSDGSQGQVVLLVGRLIESKALDVVIKATHRLSVHSGISLRIIGDGPLRGEIKSWIEQGPARDRMALYDYCETWWQDLAHASVLVSMSRYEGQPNVVLEAMAGGCPLIVSDIPAHREILRTESARFVPVDDEAELVKALDEMLSHPEAARAMAQAASADAARLTVASAAQAYEDVYRKIVKGWR